MNEVAWGSVADLIVSLSVPPEPRFRLVVLPAAGAGPSRYRPWSEHLPDDIELLAVRPPGREDRLLEPPYTALDELVDDVAAALAKLPPLPLGLAGDCSGAVVAYDVVRALSERGAPSPVALWGSSCPAPQIVPDGPPISELPTEEMLATVLDFGGVDDEVASSAEFLELMEPALRADLRMVEERAAHEAPPVDVPLSFFVGRHDEVVAFDEVAAWRACTTRDFTLRVLSTGHFPFVDSAAEVLRCIKREWSMSMPRQDGAQRAGERG